MPANLSGRGTADREGARPRAPQGVLEANGVFSPLIREGSGLRERSGGCRTGTRSPPIAGPAAATAAAGLEAYGELKVENTCL
jgi:hypothetical protein